MISNLPLLFVNGKPASLDNMTVGELECFIPFLVHCFWGHDTAKSIQKPSWWPNDIDFSIPLVRSKLLNMSDWTNRLREVIRSCYKSHCSDFLLKFCDELSKNDTASLQYVNNCDGTTSLYLKQSQRLLVTFRNENMNYDKKVAINNRKSLLPHRQPGGSSNIIESETVELYLCDNCDDVFENLSDLNAHEKKCSSKDVAVSAPESPELPPDVDALETDDQPSFLRSIGLLDSTVTPSAPSPIKNESKCSKSFSRQRRTVVFNGLTDFPFSSPAGIKVLKFRQQWEKNSKPREVFDKYCTALPSLESYRLYRKIHNRHFPVRYKKTHNFWTRYQTFIHQRHKLLLDVPSQLKYLSCKPCTIPLKKLSTQDIEETKSKLKIKYEFEFVSSDNFRNFTDSKSTSTCVMLDVIDLCSDDEDQSSASVNNPSLNSVLSRLPLEVIHKDINVTTVPEALQNLCNKPGFESTQCELNVRTSSLPKTQVLGIENSAHNHFSALQDCHNYASHIISID